MALFSTALRGRCPVSPGNLAADLGSAPPSGVTQEVL